jgi:hypothetical protein
MVDYNPDLSASAAGGKLFTVKVSASYNLLSPDLDGVRGFAISNLTNLLSTFLNHDHSLRLVINVCTFWHFNLYANVCKNGLDFVFSYPFMQCLQKYRDRIDVITNVSWVDVLNILSNTKLIVSPLVSPSADFSALSSEGPMFGIPIILGKNRNPFQDESGNKFFDKLITVQEGISKEFLDKLSSLFFDYNFYRIHGNAYRDYVRHNTTYSAYVNKLDDIILKRRWY